MDHRHQKDMDLLDDVNNMTVLDAVIADLAVRLEAEINDMDEAVECFGKSHRTEKGL